LIKLVDWNEEVRGLKTPRHASAAASRGDLALFPTVIDTYIPIIIALLERLLTAYITIKISRFRPYRTTSKFILKLISI
jgi:hypothetical protein